MRRRRHVTVNLNRARERAAAAGNAMVERTPPDLWRLFPVELAVEDATTVTVEP